jgi:hypothetical protein
MDTRDSFRMFSFVVFRFILIASKADYGKVSVIFAYDIFNVILARNGDFL